MEIKYIIIESLKPDTPYKTEIAMLKNPFLFCFASSGSFKIQILRGGAVCYTSFMHHRINQQGEVQFRPSPNANYDFDKVPMEYEFEITNMESLACDLYISIWE